MNLTLRGVSQKPVKAKPNLAYLRRVRELPCCICEAFGEIQMSPTAAHHVIHGRYGNLRTADDRAIPLCEGHHQGMLDGTKLALHRAPQQWRNRYGPDTEWTEPTRDKLGWSGK